MRIGGGERGGRSLKTKGGGKKHFRPTSSRTREAIFNILPHQLEGRVVLDLFAGSGAFGLEALSRGAAAAVFVDVSRDSFRMVKDNLRALDFLDRGEMLAKKTAPALADLEARQRRFDLVFLDPPYDGGLVDKTLRLLAEKPLLGPDAVVVVEHSRRETPADRYPPLGLRDRRQYGDSWVSFYQTE